MARKEPSSTEREFAFRDEDFRRIKALIYEKAGINLSDSKRQLVYSRLARRIRALRLDSFKTYLAYLERMDSELEHFVNALTTNLTSFFRESHHFDFLAEHAVTIKPAGRPLRVWCTAASTGEEPYSIAMALSEAFQTPNPPVEILATDIDSEVLRHAEAGIYGIDRVGEMSQPRLKRFFLRGRGKNAGKVRVADTLRRQIKFQRLNLLDPKWTIEGPFDVIFCRNVMIYFDKDTQYSLIRRMVPLLPAGGYYFAGHSESFLHAADLVQLVERSIYRPARPKAALLEARR
mgnify:CR=1 FL=1